MYRIQFGKSPKTTHRVLFLGAHSDDIEIGCGGTILRFMKERRFEEVWWIVFAAHGQRAGEARKSAELFLEGAKIKNVVLHSFRDGYFPYSGSDIKDCFEELKAKISPQVIFTHYRNDLHQDHRIISELTWNTFRDHLILEYEILKYDGDLGAPNFFVHLTDEISRKKIDYIRTSFKTQGSRKWFTDDSFTSLLRLRGVESNAPEKYAEAFYCRKMVL